MSRVANTRLSRTAPKKRASSTPVRVEDIQQVGLRQPQGGLPIGYSTTGSRRAAHEGNAVSPLCELRKAARACADVAAFATRQLSDDANHTNNDPSASGGRQAAPSPDRQAAVEGLRRLAADLNVKLAKLAKQRVARVTAHQ
eukprot:584667-Pyramimonas_sp.AAC.1